MWSGGPGALVYGFLLVWIGTLSVFATLSELVSMAPTSSGQYHWVAMLAPVPARRALSYITGKQKLLTHADTMRRSQTKLVRVAHGLWLASFDSLWCFYNGHFDSRSDLPHAPFISCSVEELARNAPLLGSNFDLCLH